MMSNYNRQYIAGYTGANLTLSNKTSRYKFKCIKITIIIGQMAHIAWFHLKNEKKNVYLYIFGLTTRNNAHFSLLMK